MSPKSWVKSLFAPRTARRPVRRPARMHLAAEPLEARALMATGIGVNLVTLPTSQQIVIQGTALNDNVTVSGGNQASGWKLYVGLSSANGTETRQFDLTAMDYNPSIVFRGGDGNDSFTDNSGYDHSVTAYGDNGNDALTGGNYNDMLYGGAGNDTFNGRAGTDFAYRDADDTAVPVAVEGWIGTPAGVTDVGLINRELRVVGGDGANTVRVSTATDGSGAIEASSYGAVFARLAPAQVDRLFFDGRGGMDFFTNNSALPSRAFGGSGNDVLLGGSGTDDFDGGTGIDYLNGRAGNDKFNGSAGNDRYDGGDGQDVLDRRGEHGMFFDGGEDDTTYNSAGTKVAGRLSPAELNAVGQLNAFRVGDRVWLTGPSGAGFAVRAAQWTETTAGGTVTFSTTRAVTFETSWGNITLPATGLAFSVKGGTTPAAGVAKAPDFYLGTVPLSSAGLTDNTVGQFFQTLSGKFTSGLESASGGDLTTPGASWGIALGNGVGDDAAPLNPAVPYLFFHEDTGTSFKYQNASYSNGISGTAAYAPGDGTIYLGLTGVELISDIAIGVSTEGYLPYEPEKMPNGVSDPNIYGHLYLRGAIDFSSFDIPVEINGELVVDLDADDNGTLGGGAFTAANTQNVILDTLDNLTNPSALTEGVAQVAADLSVGLNAGISFSMEGFSLSLATGSFWRTPEQMAFKMSSDNLFEGIPVLEDLITTGGFSIEGWRNTDGTFAMGAELKTGSVAGMSSASMSAFISSQKPFWSLDATVTLFSLPEIGSATVSVKGYIDPRDGTFDFEGSESAFGVTGPVRVTFFRHIEGYTNNGPQYVTGGGVWVGDTMILGY